MSMILIRCINNGDIPIEIVYSDDVILLQPEVPIGFDYSCKFEVHFWASTQRVMNGQTIK